MDNEELKYFIWISGAINSGKTTVANLLNKRIKNSVNIELDTLSSFDQTLPIDRKLNFIIKDGIDIAKNWTERKFLAILNWPIYGNELTFMQEYSLTNGLTPIVFNLTPDYEHLKINRGDRILEDWELKRIKYMYKECKMDKPVFGYSIDNSLQTAEETVSEILKILSEKGIDVS